MKQDALDKKSSQTVGVPVKTAVTAVHVALIALRFGWQIPRGFADVREPGKVIGPRWLGGTQATLD